MKMLGRAELCTLVDLEVEAFNAMRRRDQLPAVPPFEMPEENVNERGYTPLGAFLLIMALKLADTYQVSRSGAVEILSGAIVVAGREHWPDVCRTSTDPDRYRHILFAALDLPSVRPTRTRPFSQVAVGTLADIVAAHPAASGMIAVSVTACAATMRHRAKKGGIDLGDFFEADQ